MFRLYNEGFLRHPQQPHNPCYRKCLCYTLHTYFLRTQNSENTQRELENMLEHYQQKQLYRLKDYLGMYPTIMSEQEVSIGYVLVDETKNGIFPLIIYSESNSESDSDPNIPRISGLNVAISDIRRNQSNILRLFTEHDSWEKLEPILEGTFNYPRQTQNDNQFNINQQTG